jgi:hypothetical protein
MLFLVAPVLAFAAMSGLSAATHPVSAAPDRVGCAGYPEPRIWVDAQSWWTRTPGKNGTAFGHAHAGACIPERETLRADSSIDVRLILHDNPGLFHSMSLVFKGTDYEVTVHKAYSPNFTCAVGTCTRWVSIPIKVGAFRHSGLQEIRLRMFVDEPDGNRMIVSLNWQSYIENGESPADVSRQPYLRGKGWYTGHEYCEGDITTVPLPDGPLSGKWTPTVRFTPRRLNTAYSVDGDRRSRLPR